MPLFWKSKVLRSEMLLVLTNQGFIFALNVDWV